MNLDNNDIELIRATVEAAVGKAVAESTKELATKTELREFRAEVKQQWESTYNREMIDRFREEQRGEIERLWVQVKTNQNVLSSLWSNAWVKVGLVAGVLLQLYELWRIFQ